MLIEGFASTPDLDAVRDMVLPSAFAETIKRRGLNGPKGVKLLWQHDPHRPLGRILELKIRNNGLFMRAEVDEEISWGRDAAAVLKAVGGLSFSIGYRILDADIGQDVNGHEYLILTKLDLFEVSVVTVPCNDECFMTFAGDPQEKLAHEIRKLKGLFEPDLATAVAQFKRLTEELRR